MADIARVSPAEAKKLVDEQGYTYVDVRTEPEYAAGHPVGSVNIPVMHPAARGMAPNPDFLEVVTGAFPKDAKLVVGCRSGQRSMRAAEILTGAGYTSIVDQRAGYDGARNAFGGVTEPGWAPSGLPTETSTAGGSYAEQRAKAGKG